MLNTWYQSKLSTHSVISFTSYMVYTTIIFQSHPTCLGQYTYAWIINNSNIIFPGMVIMWFNAICITIIISSIYQTHDINFKQVQTAHLVSAILTETLISSTKQTSSRSASRTRQRRRDARAGTLDRRRSSPEAVAGGGRNRPETRQLINLGK